MKHKLSQTYSDEIHVESNIFWNIFWWKNYLSQTYSDEIQARVKHILKRILMKHKSSQIYSDETQVKSIIFWWNTKCFLHSSWCYMFQVIRYKAWKSGDISSHLTFSNPLCWHSMSDTLTFYSGPFGFHSSLKYFEWKFGKEIWNVIEEGSSHRSWKIFSKN